MFTGVGTVLNRAGNPLPLEGDELLNAPLFPGSPGVYLLGDKRSRASTGSAILRHVLGHGPNVGEQYARLDASGQTDYTSTCDGSSWDILPVLDVGQSGHFNVEPVPEPSVLALAGLTPPSQRFPAPRRHAYCKAVSLAVTTELQAKARTTTRSAKFPA